MIYCKIIMDLAPLLLSKILKISNAPINACYITLAAEKKYLNLMAEIFFLLLKNQNLSSFPS